MKKGFREAVRKERSYELSFEGHRRMDLVRWGIYYNTIQETAKRIRLLVGKVLALLIILWQHIQLMANMSYSLFHNEIWTYVFYSIKILSGNLNKVFSNMPQSRHIGDI